MELTQLDLAAAEFVGKGMIRMSVCTELDLLQLEDIQFDLIAAEFIEKEVIAPEVEEEAAVVATDLLHHYDNKITKRELKEVRLDHV